MGGAVHHPRYPLPAGPAPRPGHRRCDRVGRGPGRSTDPGGDRGMGRGPARLEVPTWIEWSGATQVLHVRRIRIINGRKHIEVVCAVSSVSLTHAQPRTITTWTQGHWGIGNAPHWVRDVTYDRGYFPLAGADRHQLRAGNGPHVIAALRLTAISLLRLDGGASIATPLRHHAADRGRPTTSSRPYEQPRRGSGVMGSQGPVNRLPHFCVVWTGRGGIYTGTRDGQPGRALGRRRVRQDSARQERQRAAYGPRRASRSSCDPNSLIRPSSTTATRSAS